MVAAIPGTISEQLRLQQQQGYNNTVAQDDKSATFHNDYT